MWGEHNADSAAQKQLRDSLLGLALILSTVALVAPPRNPLTGLRDGLALCFNVIVPSCSPSFVLSSLVVDLGLAAYLGRAMEGSCAPFSGSAGLCCSGSPGLYRRLSHRCSHHPSTLSAGSCSKIEAERLLAFCNNSGPAFIFGVVGAGVFGDGRVGLLLYITHAGLYPCWHTLSLLRRQSTKKEFPPGSPKPIETVTSLQPSPASITRALQSTLNICAFCHIFCRTFSAFLSAHGVLSAVAEGLSLIGFQPEWAQPSSRRTF